MSSRLESALAATLGLWLGALGMTAAAAATLFPAMKRLAPALPDYAGYQGEHWLIAAGIPMQRVFSIFDMVQAFCVVVAAVLAGVLLLRRDGSRVGSVARVRAAVVLLLALAAGYYLLALAPRMADDLRRYWDCARSGDAAAATNFRAGFDARHVAANRLLSGIGLGVAVALVLTLAAPARPRS